MKRILSTVTALLVAFTIPAMAQYGGGLSGVASNSTWGLIVGSMSDQSDLNTVQTNVEARLAAEEIATTNEAALRAAVNVIATNAQTRVGAAETAAGILTTNVYTKAESGSTFATAAQGVSATNAQTRAAALEVTITNIPAASITSGNIVQDRMTNVFPTIADQIITNAGTGYTNLWTITNGRISTYSGTGTMP